MKKASYLYTAVFNERNLPVAVIRHSGDLGYFRVIAGLVQKYVVEGKWNLNLPCSYQLIDSRCSGFELSNYMEQVGPIITIEGKRKSSIEISIKAAESNAPEKQQLKQKALHYLALGNCPKAVASATGLHISSIYRYRNILKGNK